MPVDLSDFDVPGRGHGILDVFRWRYLLQILIRKGTATRYRNSVLGWVWSYVKPASQFVIYYFIMGFVFNAHRDIPNFAVYLFAGVIAVNLFNEAFGNATTAIVDNRALVKKIYLPRELFPVAAVVGALIHFMPQLVILLVVLIFVGWTPSVMAIVGVLVGVVLIMTWALALGLFFAGLNVRFRDAQNFVDLIKMFSTWTSPVLYTIAAITVVLKDHPVFLALYQSNPLTVAIGLFHDGFWAPTASTAKEIASVIEISGDTSMAWLHLLVAFVLAFVVLFFGQLTFRRFERTFAQDL